VDTPTGSNRTVLRVDVLTPRSLDEALRLKSEHPEAVPIEGGTDLMVSLNFDRSRPGVLLNLNEVPELRGWSREDGVLRLAAGLTYTEAMQGKLAELVPALAEAARTVGSPQIRNRGTIGGNLATSSPAGDAVPPLLVEGAEVECSSVRGSRRVPLGEFITGVKQNTLETDELITAVWFTPSLRPQTFMKVGLLSSPSPSRQATSCARPSARPGHGPCSSRRRAQRRAPSRSVWLPRPRRSTTFAVAPPTAGMRCAS
jgi:CO/xanthine dehydrogenase FAD-binding subunit